MFKNGTRDAMLLFFIFFVLFFPCKVEALNDTVVELLIKNNRIGYAEQIIFSRLNSDFGISDTLTLVYYQNQMINAKIHKNEPDSALYYARRSEKLLPHISDSSLIVSTWLKLSEIFIKKGRIDSALFYNEKVVQKTNNKEILQKSFRNLAKCFSALGKHNRAIEFINRSIDLANHQDSMELGEDLFFIGRKYYHMKEYDHALSYLMIADSIAQKGNDLGLRIKSLIIIANIHGYKHNRVLFHKYTDKYISLAKITEKTKPIILGNYNLAEDAFKNEEYFNAISYSLLVIKLMEKHPIPRIEMLLKKYINEAYRFSDDFKKVLAEYERFLKNNPLHVEFATFEHFKMLLEDKPIYIRNLRYLYFSSGIVLLILLFVFLKFKKWPHLNYPSLGLKKKITDSFSNISVPDKKNKNQLIYDQFIYLLDSEELYLNPNLTQRELVLKIGTNNRYFYQALKECGNQSFISILNEFRLKKAKEIIKQNSDERNPSNLSDIFSQCGFSSNQSFYRVFKSLTGLTPGEYAQKFKV